jgi:HD-GYP domain-containing protein (c-di-GMP phosphodiesterase class II)
MSDHSAASVNPHYLDRVIETTEKYSVATTEDIVAASGLKLLARGARVDATMRDRLLQHKLRKPLEHCLEVAEGVDVAQLKPVVDALREKQPLLREICSAEQATLICSASLSRPMQSLLTVYATSNAGRLEHATSVAMVAVAIGRKVLPGETQRQGTLALAGLVHDIGELYIDPSFLRKGTRLEAEQWRHIVAHPLVGSRVLRDLAGAGRDVADAVLLHHERLDGFGYPLGAEGNDFTLNGQIIAVAEWLVAMVESRESPLQRAGMAVQLIPGEFDARLLEAVSSMTRAAPDAEVELLSAAPLELAEPRILRLAETFRRFRESRLWIDERIARARPRLKRVLSMGLKRMSRIQASFNSTGLDPENALLIVSELAAMKDAKVYAEVTAVVGELEWRMRELEREQRLHASLLSKQDEAIVTELIARLKGTSVAPRGASSRSTHSA